MRRRGLGGGRRLGRRAPRHSRGRSLRARGGQAMQVGVVRVGVVMRLLCVRVWGVRAAKELGLADLVLEQLLELAPLQLPQPATAPLRLPLPVERSPCPQQRCGQHPVRAGVGGRDMRGRTHLGDDGLTLVAARPGTPSRGVGLGRAGRGQRRQRQQHQPRADRGEAGEGGPPR